MIVNLKRIPDYRGEILHIAKKSELSINSINEVYASMCYPNMYKAWHYHTKQTQNYVVVDGIIRLVISKNKWNPGIPKNSVEFNTLYIGNSNYQRVTIEPGYINGYTAVGNKSALVINVTDFEHDSDEMLRFDLNDFVYDWYKNF